jgi:protoporphyrin/coproporphyrin ferrochelatase
MKYDAILVVSFGGPEGVDDVIPFLENVLRGRNVPRERMLAVAEHYYKFGGVSPINEQNRQLIAALSRELEARGPQLPIYWGNRNWQPLLPDTIRQMRDDGIKRALAFVTSAYSSYSSCRQYRENIEDARKAVGPDAPVVDKLGAFYNHPGFILANAENVAHALKQVPGEAYLVFTAHSIPLTMAMECRYEAQLREASQLVADAVGNSRWRVAYQSRSGPPSQPWLGPDILDCLRELKESGVNNVVVSPVGFVSDHMEVVYDLDFEAKQLSEELGINMVRAATAGTHPAFVEMIRNLINEPTVDDMCAVDCCLPGRRS